jgi:uncharacterized RDD family membrane protein YckC
MAGKKDDPGNRELLTPLQRYLAKQRESAVATEASRGDVEKTPKQRGVSQPAPGDHQTQEAHALKDGSALEACKPHGVSPQVAVELQAFREFAHTQNLRVEVSTGSFWPRVGAAIIDVIFVETVAHALAFVLSLRLSFTNFYFTQGFPNLSLLVAIFFYYGWFYSKKGASPGKMAMGLKVVEMGSGRNLGYWRSFFRETLGKSVSGILLGIGFLLVAFRKDHLALHDMIFDTRVIKQVRQ